MTQDAHKAQDARTHPDVRKRQDAHNTQDAPARTLIIALLGEGYNRLEIAGIMDHSIDWVNNHLDKNNKERW